MDDERRREIEEEERVRWEARRRLEAEERQEAEAPRGRGEQIIGAVLLIAVAIGVVSWIASGDGSQGGEPISSAESGAEWPFTVESGEVRCEDGASALFDGDDGETYALNGIAKGQAARRGWREWEEIYNERGDIQVVLQAALRICDQQLRDARE
jgi:hypothetical protein